MHHWPSFVDLVPLAVVKCRKIRYITCCIELSLGQLLLVVVVVIEMYNRLIPNMQAINKICAFLEKKSLFYTESGMEFFFKFHSLNWSRLTHWPSKFFQLLNVIKQISFWNQIQKSLSMKPSNPHVVYSSLVLEHEDYFRTENQNCEKKKKSSHWSQNVAGQIFQLVIRNVWGEIIYVSLQKYKMVFSQTSLCYICIHIASYPLLDEIVFSGRYRGFWAVCPLPSES